MLSLTLLDEKDSEGRNLWRLNEEFKYRLGPRCYIRVPAGFVTNFGTVPRWAYRWVGAPAELREPAALHDWMTNEKLIEDAWVLTQDSGFSRWIADAVFYEHLGKRGIKGWRRLAIFLAVRYHARRKGLQ